MRLDWKEEGDEDLDVFIDLDEDVVVDLCLPVPPLPLCPVPPEELDGPSNITVTCKHIITFEAYSNM